jgi:hypothetical protein
MATPSHAADLEELGREAVIELCPKLMDIETPLAEESQIVSRGYSSEGTHEHARAGTVDYVFRQADDGEIRIGNSRDANFCQVSVDGPGARRAFDGMLADYRLIDNTLFPDPTTPLPDERLELTTLRTPAIDEVYLGVQFFDASAIDAGAPLIIQQYLLEE